MAEQRADSWELLWLPYLPLAIGEIANLHVPFLNVSTRRLEKEEGDEAWIEDQLRNGYTWEWEIWGEQLVDEKFKCSISVLSDGKTQLMIKEKDGARKILEPDKVDYINEITKEMAYIHGKAIDKMLTGEG